MSDTGRPAGREALRCPSCATRLVEVERSDVLIDACPDCRGVWLDRGELDKILVRERQLLARDPDDDFYAEVEGRGPGRAVPGQPLPHERLDHERERRERDHYNYKKRKRRSLLEDLFDFD